MYSVLEKWFKPYINFAVIVAGMARYVCQGKCEDIPNCNELCQRVGYQGGKCVPPLCQYCCYVAND